MEGRTGIGKLYAIATYAATIRLTVKSRPGPRVGPSSHPLNEFRQSHRSLTARFRAGDRSVREAIARLRPMVKLDCAHAEAQRMAISAAITGIRLFSTTIFGRRKTVRPAFTSSFFPPATVARTRANSSPLSTRTRFGRREFSGLLIMCLL